MKRMLFAAVVVLATMALPACGGSDGARTRVEAPATGDADATVRVVDVSFSPDTTTIRTGGTVAWVWDKARLDHDVVFDDDGPASPLQRAGTWQRTFDRAGTYEYVCTLHPNMTGQIIVR